MKKNDTYGKFAKEKAIQTKHNRFKNKAFKLAASIMLCLTILVTAVSCGITGLNMGSSAAEVDVLQHASITLSGKNGRGTARMIFNWETFERELFLAADGADNLFAMMLLSDAFNVDLEPRTGLSNGDEILVTVTVDDEIANEFSVRARELQKTIIVEGLTDMIDSFYDIDDATYHRMLNAALNTLQEALNYVHTTWAGQNGALVLFSRAYRHTFNVDPQRGRGNPFFLRTEFGDRILEPFHHTEPVHVATVLTVSNENFTAAGAQPRAFLGTSLNFIFQVSGSRKIYQRGNWGAPGEYLDGSSTFYFILSVPNIVMHDDGTICSFARDDEATVRVLSHNARLAVGGLNHMSGYSGLMSVYTFEGIIDTISAIENIDITIRHKN